MPKKIVQKFNTCGVLECTAHCVVTAEKKLVGLRDGGTKMLIDNTSSHSRRCDADSYTAVIIFRIADDRFWWTISGWLDFPVLEVT